MKKFLILSLVALAGVFSMNAAQGEKAFGAQSAMLLSIQW